jgi:hypothetical protein
MVRFSGIKFAMGLAYETHNCRLSNNFSRLTYKFSRVFEPLKAENRPVPTHIFGSFPLLVMVCIGSSVGSPYRRRWGGQARLFRARLLRWHDGGPLPARGWLASAVHQSRPGAGHQTACRAPPQAGHGVTRQQRGAVTARCALTPGPAPRVGSAGSGGGGDRDARGRTCGASAF